MSMELKRFICPLTEVKVETGDANSDEGKFSGYASVWDSIDKGGDTVKSGAYTKTLENWNAKGMMPQLLFYHNMDEVIGEWTTMREDEKGLYVEGRLWIRGAERLETAQKAYNILRSNSVKGLSIGYIPKDYDIETFEGGSVRVLKEIDLMEVSVAPWAMEPKAEVTGVKSLLDGEGCLLSKREVEKVLRDAKLSTRQAKAFIAGGYEALEREAKGGVEPDSRDESLDWSGVLASLKSISTNIHTKE